ncbi:MAG TPA: hypothetical protein VGC81_17095 [Candidatus Methylomirabilis sp.]
MYVRLYTKARVTWEVHIVDFTDPMKPQGVGRYHLEDFGSHDIIVEDDVLYQAYYEGGVRVDVSGELHGFGTLWVANGSRFRSSKGLGCCKRMLCAAFRWSCREGGNHAQTGHQPHQPTNPTVVGHDRQARLLATHRQEQIIEASWS